MTEQQRADLQEQSPPSCREHRSSAPMGTQSIPGRLLKDLQTEHRGLSALIVSILEA